MRRARVPASIDVSGSSCAGISFESFFAKRREFSKLRKLTYEARLSIGFFQARFSRFSATPLGTALASAN